MRRRLRKISDPNEPASLLRGRIPMASLVQTLAVAEYLSFHRAARALGTSQSSVSARVKALEEDLGILLFQRNTRGVRLTEAGRSFVAQVGGALDTLDRAVKTAGMVARFASVFMALSRAGFWTACWTASAAFMPTLTCILPKARRAKRRYRCARAGWT